MPSGGNIGHAARRHAFAISHSPPASRPRPHRAGAPAHLDDPPRPDPEGRRPLPSPRRATLWRLNMADLKAKRLRRATMSKPIRQRAATADEAQGTRAARRVPG